MLSPQKDLGTLVSVHGTSPAFLQRAAIVAVLSFFFFIAMLVIFYLRQQMIYFVLSTAFLIVYVFTLIGWVMQKRNIVSIYEDGVSYRKFSARWDEMRSVRATRQEGISLTRNDGLSVTIPKTISNFAQIAAAIRSNLPTEP
jgi:ABC-type bacteriocin/lantibiotic exporter with double-glycine peptidase domain